MPFLPHDKFGLLSTRGGRGRPTHPIVRSQLNESTYKLASSRITNSCDVSLFERSDLQVRFATSARSEPLFAQRRDNSKKHKGGPRAIRFIGASFADDACRSRMRPSAECQRFESSL